MQKVFNALSVLSFLMSGALFGASVMMYSRIGGMVSGYLDSITGDVTGKVTEMLPEKIEKVMPQLPTETGLPIKSPF